jgi:hypothetical protein
MWKHPEGSEIARAGVVWVMMWLYWAVVAIGLLLFIVPGMILAVRGSLALVIICLEKRGPIEAFYESSRLTEKKFWLVGRYFALPTMVCLALYLVYPICVLLLAPSAGDDSAFSSWPWSMQHIPLVAAFFFGALAFVLMQIDVCAMQVRLYSFLKTLESETSAAVTEAS